MEMVKQMLQCSCFPGKCTSESKDSQRKKPSWGFTTSVTLVERVMPTRQVWGFTSCTCMRSTVRRCPVTSVESPSEPESCWSSTKRGNTVQSPSLCVMNVVRGDIISHPTATIAIIRFGNSSHLKRHMTSHSTDGFPCSHCSRVFKRKDGLETHFSHAHRCQRWWKFLIVNGQCSENFFLLHNFTQGYYWSWRL